MGNNVDFIITTFIMFISSRPFVKSKRAFAEFTRRFRWSICFQNEVILSHHLLSHPVRSTISPDFPSVPHSCLICLLEQHTCAWWCSTLSLVLSTRNCFLLFYVVHSMHINSMTIDSVQEYCCIYPSLIIFSLICWLCSLSPFQCLPC